MKQKKKLGRKLIGFLLTLAMVVGLMPGMGLTAKADDQFAYTFTATSTSDWWETWMCYLAYYSQGGIDCSKITKIDVLVDMENIVDGGWGQVKWQNASNEGPAQSIEGTPGIRKYTVEHETIPDATGAIVQIVGSARLLGFVVYAGDDVLNSGGTMDIPELTVPQAITGLKESGSDQALVTAGTAAAGSIEYSLDNHTWSTDVPKAKDKGDYTVYYRLKYGDNNSQTYTSLHGAKGIPVTIDEAEQYPLWVGGVQVTSENADNIDGAGKASYNDETKTLTVTEAPGMTIVGTVPATLTAGQEIQIRVQHVVTAADAAAGNIKNEVTVKIGDLEKKGEDTVTTAQIPITVTAASATKEYDGTALTNNGYTLTSGLLSNGHTIQSITVTGSQTEVGSSANVVSGMVITDAAGNNVTAGYAITYANGTLTVTEQEQQNQGVQTYTLTIQYWMDGKVTSTVRRTAASGTAYDVVTPPVEGYTPDLERVSGTLTANTEYDVVYTVNEYTLTIRYVYPNGEPATDPFVGGFLFGEDYSIPAPVIPGFYTANRVVTGTMPARDVTVTVIFAEAENLIHIDDFETPLGLGLGSINAGETIE
jgi:hypothetical protein